MLVLGIESASDQCGCALANENGVIAETRLALPRRHAEALAPQMRFVCEQAGVALGDVDVVAVDCGPGLYTGLRAGLATAKATAAALEIGAVPIGSLEALAFGAAAVAQPGETVLSVLDARRGEVFWAWYRVAAEPTARLVRLSAPQVGPPTDLLPALTSPGENPSGRTVVVGDGALRYADQLAAGNAVIAGPELRFPSPAAVALLGRERALAGGTVPPEQVDALYLRSPDAQPRP
ncbi:MAG: tRNA (adenosine(37)-N6)-threonylcarbamoyltransferase complex dimerization subunit type 1 TsaB [bacterium]|nr:tRNA (adenosine(37)-N6)-threonylcarbamoyltransferase complex dimerization subunit type 1 TsaB [bacterium]